MSFMYIKGEQKKVHPKFDSASIRDNFSTVCLFYSRINVHWVLNGVLMHIKFQVKWTNNSELIMVGSWGKFWAGSFFAHPLKQSEAYSYSSNVSYLVDFLSGGHKTRLKLNIKEIDLNLLTCSPLDSLSFIVHQCISCT